MCGIAGLFQREASVDEQILTAMRDIIVHRGPDAGDNFIDGPLGFGHRRLSIIDVGGGHQPMATPDGRFVICYNGEIYNYQALRAELEQAGVRFRTHSDTEVILWLHATANGAAEVVSKLNGIFAYALWDRQSRKLLLARDRAGIKPLYYAAGSQGLAFASEIKALFESRLVTPKVNEARIAEYLVFRQVAGPENLFDGVMVLPPGHTMTVTAGVPDAPRRYWTVQEPVEPFRGSYQDAVDALDARLNAAVKGQLMSEVPLGTFCSGGIDSSLTSAIAAKHSSRAINTFSVGFHEAAWDESAYARLASRACGSIHHELRIDEAEYASMLPRLVWHHDLPLNFANSVHIFAVSKLARQHVTVVLTGEGADELFGGYPRYYIPRLLGHLQKIPGFMRNGMVRMLAGSGDHRLRKLARFAGRSADDTLLFNCTGIERDAVLALLPNAKGLPLEYRMACIEEARRRGLDEVSALAQLDFQTYLVSILNRQDKMSMATSIEARVPYLDNDIIDFAHSLPLSYKQTLRHRKRVLKDVALRYLPAEIVHRRKSGFGVPLQQWFAGNGPLAKLLDEAVADPGFAWVDRGGVQKLIAQHRANVTDHSELLWGVLNLQIWRKAYGL